MRRTALVIATLALAFAALVFGLPWLRQPHDFAASVPSPAALERVATIPLTPREPVCFSDAVIEQHSAQMRFSVALRRAGTSPPLLVTLRGSGYRADVPIAAGYASGLVAVPVRPASAPVALRVCLRDKGPARLDLLASNDRTRSRSVVTVGQRPIARSVWFGFYEAEPRTIVERTPLTLQRMTAFRPGIVTRGSLWVLLVLFAMGVPAASLWAVGRAYGDDEAARSRAGDPSAATRARTWRDRLLG